ncbi:hypothetical protein [Chryseobacterium indoltheticum]|nr:hypothetical protein [Chryseobacterium indoltheticum]
MNITNLTEKLWEYWGESKRDEIEKKEILRKELFEIFDGLECSVENFHHVQEIRNKIVHDMDKNEYNSIETVRYTSDLVFYGYK